MIKLVALVPLFPIIGFLLLGLFGKKWSKSLASIVGSGAIFASFAVAVGIFIELLGADAAHKTATFSLFEWIDAGKF